MRRNRFLRMFLAGALVWMIGDAPLSGEGNTPSAAAGVQSPAKPFGIDRRIPWTTSRVIGSPEPPLPYRVRRVFPKLQVKNPIAVAHEPGTEQLLLVHQIGTSGGPGRILRL